MLIAGVGMVQLTVRLVAVPGRVDDIVGTLLRVVMRPAQQLPGCHFAQVYQRINEPQRIDYVEEWDDLAALRPQLSCERFSRLLELVEMAAEAPEVEFRDISETHGIGYVATQRAMHAANDVEPGGH
jgi:quinol monooxygenase YgiN